MQSKKIIFSALVVLIILTFTVTSAGAQAEPADSILGGNLEVPDISDFTALPDDYTPSGNLTLDVVAPQPISPSAQYVFTKLPKFYFTRNPEASEYVITLVDITANPDKIIYYYHGAGNCGTAYCWLQPTTALKTITYLATKGGYYAWVVQAKVGGTYTPISATAYFYVFSKGFTSTFNENASKWITFQGTWTINSGAYYKTNGIYPTGVNIMQKDYFISGVVYEVRMKRKVDEYSANRIIILGNPTPFTSTNWWDDGYVIQYANDGNWGVVERINGVSTTLQNWVFSPYIEPYGWNTLTVWRNDNAIHLWFNGVYHGYISDSTYSLGNVGIGMYQGTNGKAPLLVDYAKTYYSALWPLSVPLTNSGELDPAYELVPSGTTADDMDRSR